jgi:hypothetical protein
MDVPAYKKWNNHRVHPENSLRMASNEQKAAFAWLILTEKNSMKYKSSKFRII